MVENRRESQKTGGGPAPALSLGEGEYYLKMNALFRAVNFS